MEDWKVEDTSATFFPSGFLANGRLEGWKIGRMEDTSATFFPSGFLSNGRLEGWKIGRRIPILPSCHYTYKPIHI